MNADRNLIAEYVATLADDLAKLARRHGLADLATLLDMAALQAGSDAGAKTSGSRGI